MGVRDGSTILLFGPQALSFQEDTFRHLKSIILNDAANSWILDVLAVVELVSQSRDQQEDLLKDFSTLIDYQDNEQRSARFRINTMTKKYEFYWSDHVIV